MDVLIPFVSTKGKNNLRQRHSVLMKVYYGDHEGAVSSEYLRFL